MLCIICSINELKPKLKLIMKLMKLPKPTETRALEEDQNRD